MRAWLTFIKAGGRGMRLGSSKARDTAEEMQHVDDVATLVFASVLLHKSESFTSFPRAITQIESRIRSLWVE